MEACQVAFLCENYCQPFWKEVYYKLLKKRKRSDF